MTKYVIVILQILLCLLSYFLGRSHSRIQTITKEIEVVKYVTQAQKKIIAAPNLERDSLLELMHRHQL